MKRAFVIGHPVAHSRSPLIHSHWLNAHGIKGRYDAIEVTPADLPGFFARLRGGEFVGGNVTLPHKAAAFALADAWEPVVGTIGAANTLIYRPEGIYARNTDHLGFLAQLDAQAPGWQEGLTTAIVLGAGGAARAVLVALTARGVPAIYLLNRGIAKASELVQDLGEPIAVGALADFDEAAPRAGLVVNCTTVGMNGTSFEGLALARLPKQAVVFDLVYVPLETALLKEARTLGLRAVDGLGMLLYQAVPGFEAWFGVRPEVTPQLRQMVIATL